MTLERARTVDLSGEGLCRPLATQSDARQPAEDTLGDAYEYLIGKFADDGGRTALDAFLDSDYSEQAREDAAQHFKVSERVVWTLLVNNERLERDVLDDDAETLAAAA